MVLSHDVFGWLVGVFLLSFWDFFGLFLFLFFLFEVNGRPILHSCSLIFNVSPLQIPLSTPSPEGCFQNEVLCVKTSLNSRLRGKYTFTCVTVVSNKSFFFEGGVDLCSVSGINSAC